MDNFNAAVGVGANSTLITIANDTWLKKQPIDSTELDNEQKVLVKKGAMISVLNKIVVGRHLFFNTTDIRFFGDWYLFLDHINYEGKPKELLTLAQLTRIAPYSPVDKLERLIGALNDTMAKYAINTPLRICHFIAQIAHESDGFYTTEEYADGSAYEWRDDLGNTQKGDGRRYKGRGLMQITGRANYAEISRDLGVDFVGNPVLLATPQYAALGAGWFWNKRNLNFFADRDNFEKITRIINGGTNGFDDRYRYLMRGKQVFGL